MTGEGRYIQLGEVNTWYAEYGTGEALVLLHPGLAHSVPWDDHIPAYASRFHVFTPDRRGHGRTPDVERTDSYETMAEDTVAFLENVVGEPAHLVGHSDGATVALLTALARPDLVRGVVFSSGVYHRDGWLLGTLDLDEESFEFLRSYKEHTMALYRALRDADYAVVPGTDHGSINDKPELTAGMIIDFSRPFRSRSA